MKNFAMYAVFFIISSLVLYLFRMDWAQILITSVISTIVYAILTKKFLKKNNHIENQGNF
jgi:hypothetical protein